MLDKTLQALDTYASSVGIGYGLPLNDLHFMRAAKQAAKKLQQAKDPKQGSYDFLQSLQMAACESDPDCRLPMDGSNIPAMQKLVLSGLSTSREARLLRLFDAFKVDPSKTPVLLDLTSTFEEHLTDPSKLDKTAINSMKARLASTHYSDLLPQGINKAIEAVLTPKTGLDTPTIPQITYLDSVLPAGLNYLESLIVDDPKQIGLISRGMKLAAVNLQAGDGQSPWLFEGINTKDNLIKKACTVASAADHKLLLGGHFNEVLTSFIDLAEYPNIDLMQGHGSRATKKELNGVYALCSFLNKSPERLNTPQQEWWDMGVMISEKVIVSPLDASPISEGKVEIQTLPRYLDGLSEEDLVDNPYLKKMLECCPAAKEPFLLAASEIVLSSDISL